MDGGPSTDLSISVAWLDGVLNYGFAVFGLVMAWLAYRYRQQRDERADDRSDAQELHEIRGQIRELQDHRDNTVGLKDWHQLQTGITKLEGRSETQDAKFDALSDKVDTLSTTVNRIYTYLLGDKS